jgi:tripartite-type tricarboxylate transporter receptor subunit TctC
MRAKQLFHLFAAALAIGLPATAQAQATQDFPSRRIEIVIPVPPGSATDLLGRLLAEKLSARFGQPVVSQNRPGALQQVGAEYVRRAPADGHTLLVTHSGIMANPFLFKAFTIDLSRDLSHIATVAATPWVFGVPHSLPVNSIAEFIAYAKAYPDKVNFGSTGGTVDLDLRAFKALAGIGGEIVAYPGGSQVLAALASGEIQAGLNSVRGLASMPGRVKALAVTTEQRFSLSPTLPTIAESGLPGFRAAPIWYGVWGPAGIAPAIVARLNSDINDILKDVEVEKRITAGMAHEVLIGSPADFTRRVNLELDHYRRTASQAGIRPE